MKLTIRLGEPRDPISQRSERCVHW